MRVLLKYSVPLLLFISSCKETVRKESLRQNDPKVIEMKGYVVPKGSITEPTVVTVDQSRLKKFKIMPKVIPTNLNIHPAGIPKIISIDEPLLKRITPGTDTFSLPKVIPVKDSSVYVKQPKPVNALPMRMKDASNYNIQYLDVEQGMNCSSITSVTEDKYGNIWFANYGEGISKYDGRSFSHYTTKEGLVSDYIMSMLEDRSGNLWFGSYSGSLCKYDGKCFTYYIENANFGEHSIRAILQDKAGNIWVGTIGIGAYKFDGKSFTHYTTKEGLSSNSVLSIIQDKSGNIWFGTNGGGAIRFDGRSFTNYTEKDGLCSSSVLSVLEDNAGNIWFGTNRGVSKFDGRSFKNYTVKEGLSKDKIKTLLQDRSGNIWLGTYGGGLCKFDGVTFTNYTDKEGLSSNELYSLFEDRSGNIWIATFNGGVCKFNARSFILYTDKEGLNTAYVFAIFEDRAGNIWLGMRDGSITKYDGKTFTNYIFEEILNKEIVPTIFEDKSGNIWFCSTGGGAFKYDGSSFTHYSKKEGMGSDYVYTMMQDRAGNLWFGTDEGGVNKFDGKSFTHYTVKQGLVKNSVVDITEDKFGNLWMATDGEGISMFDGKGFTNYTSKEGLPDEFINDIIEDSSGNIWIGTKDAGICKYDGKHLTQFTEKQGLSYYKVYTILEDRSGNIWTSTEKGLNVLLGAAKPKTQKTIPRIVTFKKEDGLKAEDFIAYSKLLDSKNKLWYGTGKALTVLDLNSFAINEKAPSIQLETVYLQENFVDYRSLTDTHSNSLQTENKLKDMKFKTVAAFHNYPEQLELPYHLNHLTFQFSAIDWSAPHKIKYQYKLEGLDPEWNNLTSENKADYRNIPFGNYVFKVKAIGVANKWSETFEYSFIIHPPWWRTWWAYTSYAGILFLGFIVSIRYNGKRLRARAEELQLKVEEATVEIRQQKEIAEEQRLKAQESERFKQQFLANMSHEIRTPMNAVMGMTHLLLDKDPKKEQLKYLEGIAKSSDTLLHIINDILDLSKIEAGKIDLEKIDFSIKDVVDQITQTLQHKAEEKGLQLLTNIDSNIPLALVGDPVRLNQVLMNLIGNAIKFTEKGSVELNIKLVDDKIKFSVIDTGIGIPKDKLNSVFESFSQANSSDTRKFGGTGLGLSISKQLVELHGANINIESELGKGSSFSFAISYPTGSVEKIEKAGSDKIDGSILDGLRILLADDNEFNRMVANDTLTSKSKVTIDEVSNGKEAVEALEKNHYDVILMDVQMPVMDGYEATRTIRKMSNEKSKTPIIALTASVIRSDLDKCVDAGMNDYVPKPFKAKQLFASIAKVTNRK